MNNVFTSGVIVCSPHYAMLQNGTQSVLRFLLRLFEDSNVVIPVVLKNKKADIACPKIEKGSVVSVNGSIRGKTYIDSMGRKSFILYICGNEIVYGHEIAVKDDDSKFDMEPLTSADMEKLMAYIEGED